NRQVTDRNCRKMISFELGPVFPAVDRYPQTELSAKKKKVRFHQVFLNHIGIAANAFEILRIYKCRPGFAVVGCLENVWRHVAERMTVKGGVSSTGVEVAGLDPVDP